MELIKNMAWPRVTPGSETKDGHAGEDPHQITTLQRNLY
jgi:hypothetical protein